MEGLVATAAHRILDDGAAAGSGADFEQIALLATHIASDLGLVLFDDRTAFAVSFAAARRRARTQSVHDRR